MQMEASIRNKNCDDSQEKFFSGGISITRPTTSPNNPLSILLMSQLPPPYYHNAVSESHRDELETTPICFLSSGKKPLFSFKSLNLFFSFFFLICFFPLSFRQFLRFRLMLDFITKWRLRVILSDHIQGETTVRQDQPVESCFGSGLGCYKEG